MIINRRIVKVLIVIVSSVFYFSCSGDIDTTANTSGKDIVFQYYRSFPGTEEIDFHNEKVKIFKLQTELLEKLAKNQKKIRKLYIDCPEACLNEISSLKLDESVDTKNMNNMLDDYFELLRQEIYQGVIFSGIYKSIEHKCGRSARVNLYNKVITRLYADLDEKEKEKLDFLDVESLFNTIYTDAYADIISGEFIIDCSWSILDEAEEYFIKTLVVMNSSNKQKGARQDLIFP